MNGFAGEYNNLILKLSGLKKLLFYTALLIELLLVIYERTDLVLTTPSYVFRATFLLTFAALLLTGYSLRQWIVIAAFGALSFYCYRVTGNNDLLRFTVFIAACKDMDEDRVLKLIFAVTGVGYLGIFLFSLLGIHGDVLITSEYGRDVGEETRYAFGFGHPNTLHGCYFALVLLAIYCFKDAGRLKKLILFVCLFAANILLYSLTGSRTASLSVIFGMILAVLALLYETLHSGYKKGSPLYIFGAAIVLLSIGLSVWAAVISPLAHKKHSIYRRIDNLLTGRIWSLYNNTRDHKGSFETWTLFGNRNSGQSFFDMGWVRLFYWYGIIPAVVMIALIMLFVYYIYKRQEIYVLVILCAMSVYTIVEAGFVSSYIGRNFMLPLAGIYFFNTLKGPENAGSEKGGAFCGEKTNT